MNADVAGQQLAGLGNHIGRDCHSRLGGDNGTYAYRFAYSIS